MSDSPMMIGGLMRCCIQTVRDYAGPEVPGETVIVCAYAPEVEGNQIALNLAGAWEWVTPWTE